MKISDLSLGEHSAGNAKEIPDNAARTLKNLVRKNDQIVRRKGKDFYSSVYAAIEGVGNSVDIWSWKPALRIANRGDIYYFVTFDNDTAQVFYQEDDEWQSAQMDISFTANSSITIFASPDALLISDGISSPAKIYLKTDNTINYDKLGLLAPSFKPVLSNATYTDETDQQVFSEVGFVRVAATLVDKNGIESNPSQISDAYNGQRFKYVEGLQTNYIRSIDISGIDINDETIESINIYTEVTKFSEGVNTPVFSYASNYPVNQGDNSFTLYASGTETTELSYENDVLKVADKISKAGDIMVAATGDQLYKNEGLFKYLQVIKLNNVNAQTIIDKPIRLRLYNDGYPDLPSPNQAILNFNVGHFLSNTDLPYIRLYDSDLSTLLDVFLVSREFDDQYMEIIFNTTMKAGAIKTLYLAFTGEVTNRTKYPGGFSLGGEFDNDISMAAKIFRRADVLNADTEITCWGSDGYIDGVNIGVTNLANSENNPTNSSENLYPQSKVKNPLPYLLSKNDIPLNLYINNRSYLDFDQPDIAPLTYYMAGRFDIAYRSGTSLTLEMFVIANASGDVTDRMKIVFNYDTASNYWTFILDLAEGGNHTFPNISIPTGSYRYTEGTHIIVPIFVLWSVKLNPNNLNSQVHTLYVMPLYNNGDSTVFSDSISDLDGETTVTGIAFGEKRESHESWEYIGVTGAIFQSNVNLEISDNNKEAVRNMANAMPLYLTAPIGRKFEDGSLEENSNFSLAEQVDFDNLGNYFNYIIRWTDKSGENFSDENYHKSGGACTAIIPVRGFYNSQYAPTSLIFTENSLTRLIIDDETNRKAGANQMVGEQSGYGCDSDKFIAKYGDIVFWYSKAKNHCYMYSGESPQNISIGKVEFTLPTMVFINNAERQFIVVDSGKQYIYSLEYNEWYSATGLNVKASTTIEDGKSLIRVDQSGSGNELYTYPSASDTTEETELKTKQYNTKGRLIDRVKVDCEGDVDLKVNTEYRGNPNTIDFDGISPYNSYGITYRAEFLFFTMIGLNSFTSISAEIRRY